MIISPPFLADRAEADTDESWIAKCMTGDAPGHGTFPVSFNMCWHGGLHLTAPTIDGAPAPVRAIADGEVVYHRDGDEREDTDPNHPQNYSDTAGVAKWTDRGVVVIKHTTDIGTGEQATNIVFYSIYMHLKGKVEAAAQKGKKIYRKDKIGSAGKIYGDANRIHFEIICDDANLRKLIGRPGTQAEVTTSAHGRSDSVFGEIYFQLPSGTSFYATKPEDNITTPPSATNPPVHTVDADNSFYVGMRYRAGDGPATDRGAVFFYGYTKRGTGVAGEETEEAQFLPLVSTGTRAVETRRALVEQNRRPVWQQVTFESLEYDLYRMAGRISDAQPAAQSPAPSAVYEMLRFGRVIDTTNETAVPSTIPNWQKVAYSATAEGWVNLNAAGIQIFSDADFPHWAGWTVLNDDGHAADSRCEASKIKTWVTDPADGSGTSGQKDGVVTPAELEFRLKADWVKKRLEKTIAKFPTDWVDTDADVDTQWGWLKDKKESELVLQSPMEPADFDLLNAHLKKLGWWGTAAISDLDKNHWHLQPRATISALRNCGWLSRDDISRSIRATVTSGGRETGTLTKATLLDRLNNAETNRSGATIRPASLHDSLNIAMRKYGIQRSLRTAHFFGQILQETGRLQFMLESGGDSYFDKYEPGTDQGTKLGNTQVGDGLLFKGRGLIQLTGRTNYTGYGSYRSSTYTNLAGASLLVTNAHETADAGGYYWVSKQRYKSVKNAKNENVLVPLDNLSINAWADKGYSDANKEQVTRCVNPGLNHHEYRVQFFNHALYALGEGAAKPSDFKEIT